MSRARLAGAACLFLALLPGCGLFSGDRRTLCDRWRDCWRGDRCDATPVGYPVMDGGCAMPIPGGMPYHQGPPIYMGGPGASVPLGAETLPPPGGARNMPPQIPPAGINEGKGKQFELEEAKRTGPVGPALPTGGIK